MAAMNFVKGLLLTAWILHIGSCSDLPPPDNVTFIVVGLRHGLRNPLQFLKGDTSHEDWAWATDECKQQAYALGQFLRNRYDKLIPSEFYPAKVKAYSPSAGCLISMQACMAGLFPPTQRSIWNPGLLWTPIPVEHSDPMLRMALVNCPRYSEVYQSINKGTDPAAQALLAKDPELVNYISTNSGLNATLADVADVADNIGNMKLLNATLPSWVSKPSLAGYPPKDMVTAITAFSETPAIICANNSACARLSAGFWLNQIIQTLQSIKNGTLKGRVGNFYAAHTETVLSLIRLIKAEDQPRPV